MFSTSKNDLGSVFRLGKTEFFEPSPLTYNSVYRCTIQIRHLKRVSLDSTLAHFRIKAREEDGKPLDLCSALG